MMTDWRIYALGSAFFAGLTALLAKKGVADIPSNLATLIRTFVILILLSAFVFARKEWINPASLNRRCLIFLVLSGIATGLSWLCYYRALQNGPVSMVLPIDKLSLVFSVIFAVLFLGERLGALQWAGVLFMVCGAMMAVL